MTVASERLAYIVYQTEDVHKSVSVLVVAEPDVDWIAEQLNRARQVNSVTVIKKPDRRRRGAPV